MRRNCFSAEIDSFATWQEYALFSQGLKKKCATGQLKSVEKPASFIDDYAKAEAYYQCRDCKEYWVLSSPDNAWRGYFLPVENAVVHAQRLKTSDRRKGTIGLLPLAGIMLYSLWRVIQ